MPPYCDLYYLHKCEEKSTIDLREALNFESEEVGLFVVNAFQKGIFLLL
jgi:hypothetical protein